MMNWTDDEINLLKKYHKILSNREICQKLKRSYQSIRYMASKLGLKKDYETICRTRKKTNIEIDKETINKFYWKEKKSIREISKILGLSKNTVDHYLKKFDIPKRSHSEANKLSFLKYGNWKKGLTKEKDKRIFLATERMKKTKRKIKMRKLKEKERNIGEPIKEAINRLYWKESLTQEKIAKKLNLSRREIINLMKKFDISKKPNFEYISNLKGKKHSMYGKKWEDIYGLEEAKKLRKERSLKFRQMIIKRLQNNEIPFINTKIEKIFAKELTQRKIPFVSQYPVDEKFVCDFAIPKYKIIIECDGDYWHANPSIYSKDKLNKTQKRKVQIDKFKDKYLEKKGWTVVRFFESDINRSISECVNYIENLINSSI